MSATIPVAPAGTPPVVAKTNVAIEAADTAPQLIAGLQAANPALYAQLMGSAATYAKSGGAPFISMGIAFLVAKYGLACGAIATSSCWTPDTVNTVTGLLMMAVGTVAALVNHWISKAPARAVAAPVSPAAP